ncbi:hypothetical protein C8J57DRAFT_670260 [Mycena rebaudengoi]|nr:hypothetical protein C8J57DRAFT_670260 [Mycena rebaudengoi]
MFIFLLMCERGYLVFTSVFLGMHLIHLSLSMCYSSAFVRRFFKRMVWTLSGLGLAEIILLAIQWRSFATPQRATVAVWLGLHNLFFWPELSPLGSLRQRADSQLREWLQTQVLLDSIVLHRGKLTLRMKWCLCTSRKKWRKQGEIARQDIDKGLEGVTSPWILPPEISDSICHWTHLTGDRSTRRALWITAGRIDQVNACAHGACTLLSSTQPAISIDVGNTGTVRWPLLHGIATALPDFREELANIDNWDESVKYLETKWPSDIAVWEESHYDGSDPWLLRCLEFFFFEFFICVLPRRQRRETRRTRQTLIIHGIRDSAQAVELCRILRRLNVREQDRLTAFDIVAISSPQVLRQVANHEVDLMKHVHTLAIAETGSIIYSGNPPPSPHFCEGLFNLVLEGIYRTGDSISSTFRIWAELFELGASSSSTAYQIVNDLTIPTIFNILHRASEDRKKMVTFLSELPVISQGEIRMAIRQDSVRIAIILQQIFEVESYKHDVGVVPEEEAFSVLNLTHQVPHAIHFMSCLTISRSWKNFRRMTRYGTSTCLNGTPIVCSISWLICWGYFPRQ